MASIDILQFVPLPAPELAKIVIVEGHIDEVHYVQIGRTSLPPMGEGYEVL